YGRTLGLTPARTLAIARHLEVRSVDAFREAALAGRLREVPGVGSVTEAKIVANLARDTVAPRGLTVNRARGLSAEIGAALGGEVAGAARRYAELSHELAVVVSSDEPAQVLDRFAELPAIVVVLAREERRASGLTVDGVPVSVFVTDPEAYGTELVRATGSAEYVAALGALPHAASEAEVFERLGIPYCPPELRELPGAGVPPDLVEVPDIRGELHCHTTWSDGRDTVEGMALAARERGYEYVAICDHSPNVRVVPGLDADALLRQADEIAHVNEALAPFRVLRGVECDIRSDGSLDVDDRVLETLEWVQLSLHAGQRRSRGELTRMVTEAMRHPAVRALSHPKGRILNHRPENALDLEEIFGVALETGVAVEVNGLPDRLDLSAVHVREALAAGVPLVLNSDAHSAAGLRNVELAVATARKGGAPRSAVLNCLPLVSLLERAGRRPA
ncbi:MAG TPA: PHP domain-containing protein, partial [Gaiellaceae bacterium]|nr:PHP domain-containing protein [Gaiellaceae bacterium]